MLTEIRKSRDNAWVVIEAREHLIHKVYVSSMEADDLMFIGKVTMHLKNGEIPSGEFAGRLKIVAAGSDSPRLQSYQIWAVSCFQRVFR